jgi:hypothetical protein
MHWQKRLGQRLFTPRAQEKAMPVKSDVDWEKVRAEKQAGASAPDLAKKYGVHVSSIYNHTASGNGHAGGANQAELQHARRNPRVERMGRRYRQAA